MTQEFTDRQRAENLRLAQEIFSLCRRFAHNPEGIAAALMICSATVAAQSDDTDAYILDCYSKCLFDARHRFAMQRGEGGAA